MEYYPVLKKEWGIDTSYNMAAPKAYYIRLKKADTKVNFYMILLVRIAQNSQIHRVRKYISGFQEDKGWIDECGVSFGHNGNVL